MNEQERIAIYVWTALAICAATMSGCGKAPVIDPALQPYVDRWNATYEDKVNVDVGFGDTKALQGNAVGVCFVNSQVLLDKGYWQHSLDQGKEELLFHELGHCVLGLGHDRDEVLRVDDLGNNQVLYRSIMFPTTFGNDPMYNDNRAYYLDQLKHSHASEQ